MQHFVILLSAACTCVHSWQYHEFVLKAVCFTSGTNAPHNYAGWWSYPDFMPSGLHRVGHKNRTCLSVDNSATVTRRKARNMSKVLECCRQKEPNLHSKSFKYSLPNLPKSSLPLKLGICLHSHVPEFNELTNSLPESPDLNSVNYSVLGHCNR